MNWVIYLGEEIARCFLVEVLALLSDEPHHVALTIVGVAVQFQVGQFACRAVALQRPLAHQQHPLQFLAVVHPFAANVEFALGVAFLQFVYQQPDHLFLAVQPFGHGRHRPLKCLPVQFHSLVQ